MIWSEAWGFFLDTGAELQKESLQWVGSEDKGAGRLELRAGAQHKLIFFHSEAKECY